MKGAIGYTPDKRAVELEVKLTADGDVTTAVLPKESVTEAFTHIDFLPEYFSASEGEDGYLVSPRNTLTYFKGHEDSVTVMGQTMPMFGAKTPRICFVAYAVGMKYDMTPVISIKGGKYTVFARFLMDGDLPYEDISVEYHMLRGADADYSGMAREYRKYRLSDGCRPMTERDSATLHYTSESIYVRIRCGWKPVPTPVLEQTPETEPPMHVAVDFKRVGDILDEFKRQGIEKAEICLVGWNVRGHDGRWPQTLPVEEALGGEAGLRALIKKAQDMGYSIVCHTNSSDGYTIADCWDEDLVIRNKAGELSAGASWSGGRMYNLCPVPAYETSKKMLDDTADLGFRGTHYIDVISTVPARKCYSPAHPQNRRQWVENTGKIMEYAAEKFGGISSEGGFDHMSRWLDYGLYIVFEGAIKSSVCDAYVPLWQMVYNGIVMSNPSTRTTNGAVKGIDNYLEVAEFNGRPTFYYYSKFVDDPTGKRGNWMGDRDLVCGTEEELREGVSLLKRAYDEYKGRSYLQYAFMDAHKIIAKGVTRSTFSDGSKIYVNYLDTAFECDGLTVPAKSFRLIKQDK